ncbi:MAG: hypothetical protein WC517_04370 [Patescibacteria group bacterium]
MQKIIQTSAYLPSGEKALYRSGRTIKLANEKTEAQMFADSVTKQRPENEVIVVIALTFYELYGSNDNGDGFCNEVVPGVEEKDLLKNHYKSFETNANLYYQHQSDGTAIGRVLKAFLNEKRGWVELVIEVYTDKAPIDVTDRLKNDEMISVSMGCDVSYDVCSYCLHKAKTINDHCEHVKNKLHEILDGKAVTMLNPSPKFFDISVVTIGADSVAVSTYRKAASLKKKAAHDRSNKLAAQLIKSSGATYASLCKMNDIYKGIESGDTYINEKLKDVLYKTFDPNTDLGADTVFDSILFYTYLGLPFPLRKACMQTGLDFDRVIETQAGILQELKSSSTLQEKIKSIAASLSDRKPNVSEEALGMIKQSLTDMGKIDLEATEENLAVFNLLNKLAILGKENFVKSKLTDDASLKNNSDLKDLIITEYLLY